MTLRLREHDIDWRAIDDEIVALDSNAGLYLATSGSGALLWRLLAESTTFDTLVRELVETYGIDATRAAGDVTDFLRVLSERSLLAS